jgi:hypothetical protein
MPFKPKITDEQFAEAYIECRGNLTKTAKYIEQTCGVHYTPQAVDDRVNKSPELVDQLIRLYANYCQEKAMTFADDVTVDLRLRTRIYLQILNRLTRLMLLKQRATRKVPEGVFDLNGYILRFPGNGVTAVDDKKAILEGINKHADNQ